MSDTSAIDPLRLSGLELLRYAFDLPEDELPPNIGLLLGMRAARVELGEVSFTLRTQPLFANPLGTVHGGIAATMLDSAMGCAVHTCLGPGDWYSTLELKVNYIRAVQTDDRQLTATGTTIHVGRTTATAEGRIHDENNRLIAHATTTCIVRRADQST